MRTKAITLERFNPATNNFEQIYGYRCWIGKRWVSYAIVDEPSLFSSKAARDAAQAKAKLLKTPRVERKEVLNG